MHIVLIILFILPSTGEVSAFILSPWKSVESVEGVKFGFPCDVASDSRGFFYVLDSQKKSVAIIGSTGQFSKYVKLDRKSVIKPEGIDVKIPGVFVIADSGKSAVIEFDVSGKKTDEWAIPGAGRIVDVALFGKRIFALDGEKGFIYVLENGKKGMETLAGPGDHPGKFKSPYRIFIDKNGKIYVSDVLNARIQILDIQGKSLGGVKSFGLSHDKFIRPGGVSSDGYERIFFTDMVSGFLFSYDTKEKILGALRTKEKKVKFLDPVSVSVYKQRIGVVDQRKKTLYIFDLIQ